MPWGGGSPPLAAAPLGSLYILGKGGPLTPRLWCLPLPLQHILLLHSAWRSPAGVLLHPPPRRCAAGSSSTSPSPLLDQEGGDVSRPVRVLNAEVLSVQHLVIGDSNHGEYDSIITVLSNASARDRQVVCRCNLSPMTHCLDELIDGSW